MARISTPAERYEMEIEWERRLARQRQAMLTSTVADRYWAAIGTLLAKVDRQGATVDK